MRMTPRALRTSIITATATAAISLGAASGALAATPHTPTVEAAAHYTTSKRVHVKTVKLAAKGHTAKVYKLGKNKYRADILYKGKKIALMKAYGKTNRANLNGLHVTLTTAGKVTSWEERAKPQPKPKPKPVPNKREHVRNDTLADGSMARIYKLSVNHWQAIISSGPSAAGVGTLDANGRSASGEHNGLHVVLSPDGKLTSWMDQVPAPEPTPDFEPAPDPEPTPDPVGPDDNAVPQPDNADTAPKPDDADPAPTTPLAPSTDPGNVQLTPAA